MIQLKDEKKGTFVRAAISDVCNFCCEYCPKDLGMENHTPREIYAPVLSTKEYIENMALLAQRGFENISFTGGEPLLAPNFDELAEAANSLFKIVEITTNGTKLVDSIDTLKKYIDVVKISVDAVDDDLRVRLSKSAQAREVLHNIEYCLVHGLSNLGLNFVYMKQNSQELEPLVRWVAKMNAKYNANMYISVLDLYYSRANEEFWREQYCNLKTLRESLEQRGLTVNRRYRVGCDSYNCMWNGVRVNMKDSMSCTHRHTMCEKCTEYCQEGIYSIKHSLSGWISTCPSNNPKRGMLMTNQAVVEKTAISKKEQLDHMVSIINEIKRVEKHILQPDVQECLKLTANLRKRARQYLEQREYEEMDTPVLASFHGEPYNPVFSVPLENEEVNLADSPQVYKMLLLFGGVERYYQWAHCFRPIEHEDAKEKRLREFVQLDVEMHVDTLEELMEEAVNLVKAMSGEYDPKIDLVVRMPLIDEMGIPNHHIFAKPNGEVTESFDIEINGIEVGGGDLRIMDAIEQEKMMDRFGVAKENYQEYLEELKEYHGRPIGGFAIGIQRLVMALSGVDDIRKTIAFDTWR